jgi:hypothetical protein
VGRRARAERKSKGETLVSERHDGPQFPLHPYRVSLDAERRLPVLVQKAV